MALRLALFDSWSVDLDRAWEDVLGRDPEAGVFSHPAWLRVWWETMGTGELLVAVVWDDDEPIAVFASCTCVDEDGLLSFLGSEDVTDEQVPVAVPGREVEALRFYLSWAFGDGRFSRLRFHSVHEHDRWLDALEQVAQTEGMTVSREQVDVAPAIDLPSTFDDYLASLKGHDRHELRRKRRRLSEAGEWRVRRAHVVGWEEDLAAFFAFHRDAPGDKGGFFTPERERFFRRLAADLFLLGLARLDVLELSGEVVAATFSFEFRDTFALYNSSFRADLAKLAPGMVLTGCLIEEAIAAGRRTFDFLRGDERYKKRFGPRARPVWELTLASRAPAMT